MSKIIKGYKGIMPLDLTNVDKAFHKTLIEQHEIDILNYKKEQYKLEEKDRYDNTIGKALIKMEYHNRMTAERLYNPQKYN